MESRKKLTSGRSSRPELQACGPRLREEILNRPTKLLTPALPVSRWFQFSPWTPVVYVQSRTTDSNAGRYCNSVWDGYQPPSQPLFPIQPTRFRWARLDTSFGHKLQLLESCRLLLRTVSFFACLLACLLSVRRLRHRVDTTSTTRRVIGTSTTRTEALYLLVLGGKVES